MPKPNRLADSFIHVGLGATAVPQPPFDGMKWYGRYERTELGAGEYAINPPGVWHIADGAEHATAIFITAGEETEHRPR